MKHYKDNGNYLIFVLAGQYYKWQSYMHVDSKYICSVDAVLCFEHLALITKDVSSVQNDQLYSLAKDGRELAGHCQYSTGCCKKGWPV